MEVKKSELEKFKDNVWLTRKARINASERLIYANKFVKVLNVYYSCFLIVLSIIDILYEDLDFGSLSLIITIILTISLFFIDSQQFAERANSLKNNYIDMQKILFHISNENIGEMKDYYLDLLSGCENHTNADYYKAMLQSDENLMGKMWNFIKYIFLYRFWIFMLRGALIILPFIIILYGCC